MKPQKSQQPKLPELCVRNQYIAVFASLYLRQEPRIKRDSRNRDVFTFSSEVSFREINLLYRSNDPVCKAIRDALETNHSLGKKKQLFKNTNNKGL